MSEFAFQQLVMLNQIVQDLNTTLNVHEVFEVVARHLAKLVPHDRVSIALFDKARRHFSIFSLVETQEGLLREGTCMPLEATAAAADILAGRPHLTPDLATEIEYPVERLLYESGCRSRVNVPLKVRDQIIGALNLGSTRLNAFHPADLPLLEQVAANIAAALEKARLFEEAQRRNEEIAGLYQTALEVAEEFAGQDEVQPLLERIVERATALLEGDGGGLYLTNPDGDSLTCVVSYRTPADYRGVTLQRGEGAAGKVLETGEPLIIDDYRTWPGRAAIYEADRPFRSVISVPLKWAEQVLGVLHVLDQSGTRRFNRNDLRLLEMFACYATIALTNTRQLQAARQRAKELETLHRVALEITSNLELSNLLKNIVQHAATLLGAKGGGVYLYDPEREELELVVSYNQHRDYTGYRLRLGEGLSGKVIAQRRPIVVDDYRTWPERAPQYADAPFTAVIGVPLQVGNRILGVLNITDESEGRTFNANDVYLATLFAAHAAIAVENAKLYDKVRRQSQELAEVLKQLQESYDQTLAALCTALDLRDQETEGHSRRVAELACAIAREMGLSEEKLTSLFRGGLLHDVGKIGIPDAVLHKPDPLTEEEWRLMRQHPLLGARILRDIDFLDQAVDVVLFHQERYDGRGYPYGLRGSEIPLLARIFAVADAYDAMTSHRPYRRAMDHEEATAEILRNSGTQFDPQVVQAFLQVMRHSHKKRRALRSMAAAHAQPT